ncbi:hypothetical protein GCM10009601_47260 [Streptomyces thermospinosisporus]|uniref:Uncharacterized protein n=1 Tax=Streptomyces thermospinosisporus TaxID=161482 RepID=A0ABN1Z4M8_9ACTN
MTSAHDTALAAAGSPPCGRAEARASARPAATAPVPHHSRRPSRIRCSRADRGTAKTSSVTISGCTRLSGPNASASDWKPYATTASPIPHSQRRSRTRCPSSRTRSASESGRAEAAHCCSTPATAKQTPAAREARTAIAMTRAAR